MTIDDADSVSGSAKKPSQAGFVALIGAPNAGKSTLMNRLVGSKVSIVSHKVQTTRALVRGIAIHDTAQIVFVDTPGIFQPKRRLDRAMVSAAWSGTRDTDLTALMIDTKGGITAEISQILAALGADKPGLVLVLNKIDMVKRESLLELSAIANSQAKFSATFMVSALTGDGVSDFLDYVAGRMPVGPWLYPEDQISDLPMRWLAAEITREKLLERLHQELPYVSTVETETWSESSKGVKIGQTLYVERESQRKIALGKKGQAIKAISMASRKEISQMLDRPVHLRLFVKVRRNWSDDPERYREMGLELPSNLDSEI